ncbi:glycoside hydrolase family 65 protein [Lacticaseibacillus absianus]|uniref:glycoside hydrolase family 65 protein n=1 Tax=Lacticaseibacillus absianus TaxID=2729623 RepID=UPI0015CC5CFA|nr:glycoside hydrolase family 65 protein [Lacticaseibacillus absianus]
MTKVYFTKRNDQVMVATATAQAEFGPLNATTLATACAWAEAHGPLTGGILVDYPPVQADLAVQQFIEERLNIPVVAGTGDEDAALAARAQELAWTIEYWGYQPGKPEYAAESLLTVGNGFMGLRGTLPGMTCSDDTYPATYLAGLYDEAASQVAGERVVNEDFVNAPDAQGLRLEVASAHFTFTPETVQDLYRRLDLRTGELTATATITVGLTHWQVVWRKSASLSDWHRYGLQMTLTPLDYTGPVTITAGIDGDVENYNVARYRDLNRRHMRVVAQRDADGQIAQWATTRQAGDQVMQTASLRGPFTAAPTVTQTATAITQHATLTVQVGQPVTVEKLVYVARVLPDGDPDAAWAAPVTFTSYAEQQQASAAAWAELWPTMGLMVGGDLWSQKLLNLHTYHLVVSASPLANPTLDASVTARGLHGEAYRGHIFWDELFVLPFYITHFPATAKALLMYRYRRLTAAITAAEAVGEAGAMYPWQSGRDGSEQSQRLHLNPLTGEWGEDHSRLQRHVNLAIAYNVWSYCHVSGDEAFMVDHGAEMLLAIAKFWVHKAELDPATGRETIRGVMGPDEFHEAYPGATTGGMQDNAYTNVMVAWLLGQLTDLQTQLTPTQYAAAAAKAGFTAADHTRAIALQHRLQLTIAPDGVIAQYAGYFDLKTLDLDAYRAKYGDIHRMDRILAAEGQSADDYQVAKQADTLMLFYVLAKPQVDALLADLGYQLPTDYVARNLRYYLARTVHGSTLSRVVHAHLAELIGERALADELYQAALSSDYHDIQGGTTAEGIHAGVMGATLWVAQSAFAGLDLTGEQPALAPRLPDRWQSLGFQFTWRGVVFRVQLTPTQLTVSADQPAELTVNGEPVTVGPISQTIPV